MTKMKLKSLIEQLDVHEIATEYRFNACYAGLRQAINSAKPTSFKSVSKGEYAVMTTEAAHNLAEAKTAFDDFVNGNNLAEYMTLGKMRDRLKDDDKDGWKSIGLYCELGGKEWLNRLKASSKAKDDVDKGLAEKINKVNKEYWGLMEKTRKAVKALIKYHEDEEYPDFCNLDKEEQNKKIENLKVLRNNYIAGLMEQGIISHPNAMILHYKSVVQELCLL